MGHLTESHKKIHLYKDKPEIPVFADPLVGSGTLYSQPLTGSTTQLRHHLQPRATHGSMWTSNGSRVGSFAGLKRNASQTSTIQQPKRVLNDRNSFFSNLRQVNKQAGSKQHSMRAPGRLPLSAFNSKPKHANNRTSTVYE